MTTLFLISIVLAIYFFAKNYQKKVVLKELEYIISEDRASLTYLSSKELAKQIRTHIKNPV